MSKKMGILIALIFITASTSYVAYSAIGVIPDATSFISSLYTPQRYLFLYSAYIVPILFIRQTPYYQAEYRTRLKDGVFKYVLLNSLKTALLTTLSIVTITLICTVLFYRNFPVSPTVILYSTTLFTFSFSCLMVYHVVYSFSTRPVLSVVVVFGLNLSILCIIFGVKYYIFVQNFPLMYEFTFFYIYIFAVILSSLIHLGIRADSKECLN